MILLQVPIAVLVTENLLRQKETKQPPWLLFVFNSLYTLDFYAKPEKMLYNSSYETFGKCIKSVACQISFAE
jgi:hypothetical protein